MDAISTPPEEQQSGLKTFLKVLVVFAFLYLFLLGMNGMGASFKLLGKDVMHDLLSGDRGPFLSLIIGILATTLVQSSSMTTVAVVGLVAAPDSPLPFDQAIFMIMGANLGTTVTNTLVSIGHITRSSEFKRAFSAATVHDFFNMIVLLVLFPFEIYTGWLSTLAIFCADTIGGGEMGKFGGPVKAITKPVMKMVAELVDNNGWALLTISVVLLFGGLIYMVKSLKSLMLARLENLFDKVLFKTPYRGLVLGILFTFLVQSSSISTSLAVPLVGAGVISIRQVFPYTMGANIGTTITGVIASSATANSFAGLQVAFFHVLFNVLGVVLMWPFRWLPIWIAEQFAELALRNKYLPIVYIVFTFYLLPIIIIWALS